MKLSFHLAYKNLMGAGLRTWLNAAVLSFCFVIIIFYNGFLDGWNEQSRRDAQAWEYGHGQLLHANYDPYDPFTIRDAHGPLPAGESLVPILIRQASVYPEGRMLSVELKGIGPAQKALKLPTELLDTTQADIPAIIGKRMAQSAGLKKGDQVLMRWRDRNGTFDAGSVTITGIFDTNVITVDAGQFWIPLEKLRQMTGLDGQATLAVYADSPITTDVTGWIYKSREELLQHITELVNLERYSSYILMALLLGIALLALFDTQVLSIFRRQKEIGTYVALGMTRRQVVQLFTIEGSMYSLFALVVAAVYGLPILLYFASQGIGLPSATQDMGVAINDRIYPVFGLMLILSTILIVVLSATVVSYLPARKISNMNPVNALKGKLQ